VFVSRITDRILVLGGTGMLGHEVVRTLANDFEVHASVRDQTRSRRAGVAGVHHEFHAGDESLDDLITSVRPAVVINCIGLVKQLPEASRPVSAIRLNSLFPHEVAEACARLGSRLIQISTDCVFSGDLPAPRAYTESDVPDARDVYGRTKLLGEVTDAPALTLRTSIIGWELGRVTGLLEWFAAQQGPRVSGFTNAIFSGLTTRALADVMRELVKEHPQMTGLYHVSAGPIDKYSLLVMLKEMMSRDCEIVPDPSVRVNRALDSGLLRSETGIEIPHWDEMLHEYLGERTHFAKA
jgi:dTDP-4-dehydrorhamnose reductase